MIAAATEAANELHSVIEQRRLSTRIGSSEHVRVEGWQTVGVIAGVYAVEAGGVEALPGRSSPTTGSPAPRTPAANRGATRPTGRRGSRSRTAPCTGRSSRP